MHLDPTGWRKGCGPWLGALTVWTVLDHGRQPFPHAPWLGAM